MTIKTASVEDIPAIVRLAELTWEPTYRDYISKGQIDYMFGQMYTPESLHRQMTFLHHTFLILVDDEGLPIGYASFSKRAEESTIHKLHKLYVLPELQGKGYGKLLINEVEKKVLEEGNHVLELNVNRKNRAKKFYEKQGFFVHREEDIPIGEYWMNDYVMRKDLAAS